MQPHAGKRDYDAALEGLEFPTSLAAVIRTARDHGGIDREVSEMMARLPDRQFDSLEDLYAEIRGVYLADGVAEEDLPV